MMFEQNRRKMLLIDDGGYCMGGCGRRERAGHRYSDGARAVVSPG